MSRRRLPWKRVTTSTIESNKGMSRNTLMQWSNCSTLLAVASTAADDKGQVEFITSSGSKNDIIVSRACQVTCVQWHPSEATIAIGWSDGHYNVNVLKGDNAEVVTVPLPQQEAIFHAEWSHNGKVICVVDVNGHVHMYSFNSRTGDLVHVGDYDLHEKPTSAGKMLFRQKQMLVEDDDKADSEVGGGQEEDVKMANLDKALKERNRRV